MSPQPRVPPGQRVVQGFPVLHYSSVPRIELATWRLRVFGLVEEPMTLSWEEFRALPAISLQADFHCVTHWSRLDNLWEGVSFRELAARSRPEAKAHYVMVHCHDGFTTNIPLAVLMDQDVLLAYRHDGAELAPEHGWPLRLVVPKRYAWKSAKWIEELEFLAKDQPGFWEQRGYHNDAPLAGRAVLLVSRHASKVSLGGAGGRAPCQGSGRVSLTTLPPPSPSPDRRGGP